jgi:hypothetical protein
MSLQNLIASGNYESAQAAFDAITTASVEVRDEQFYTWNGVAKVAGKEHVSGLFNAIKAAGFEAFVIQLGGKGLQLTDSDVRDMLGQFALGGLPGAQELLDQGVSLVAPWQSAGIAEPTLEQVTEAWNAEQRRLAYESIRTRANAAIEAAAEAYRASEPTIEEIVAAGVEAFGV